MELAPVAALAAQLQRFLDRDLRLHLEDEEQDLFPLLWQRAQPEDNISDILDLLSEEHGLDQDLVDFLLADLAVLAGGAQLANPIRFLVNVREFAETQRRHLAWENALLLPVARRRLTEVDLAGLARSMAARRYGRKRGLQNRRPIPRSLSATSAPARSCAPAYAVSCRRGSVRAAGHGRRRP